VTQKGQTRDLNALSPMSQKNGWR